MFGRRFFGGAYFGGRYWGDGGSGGGGDCPTVAQIWSYVIPGTGKTAAVVMSEIHAALTGPVEGSINFAQSLRILLAVAAGKTRINDLGGGNAQVEFDAAGGTDLRVQADMTGSERTNVNLTP